MIRAAARARTSTRTKLAASFGSLPAVPAAALVIGLLLTWRYAWVLDDAFIYFRYADNAALLVAGLVFNQGEYVEGYTSPLWMLLLVLVRWLRLDYWPVILTIGFAAMTLTWALAVRVNRRLTGGGRAEVHLPALFVASCYAVESHFTSGLETPFVQVAALAFAALILEPGVAWLEIVVGLAPLVRPELNVAFAIAAAWCWRQNGRAPWRLLAVGLATQAAWLAFRAAYYADVVPNTFHLKDTAAFARGLHYVHDTLRAYHLYWLVGGLFLLLGALVLVRGRGSLQVGARAVLWLAAGIHVAYVVKIGGDFVHYRYLAFPLLVFIASLGGVAEELLAAAGPGRRWGAAALGVAFTAMTVFAYPSAQLPVHPLLLGAQGNTLLMFRVEGVEDAASHRGRPDLAPREWDKGSDATRKVLRDGVLRYVWLTDTGWCREAYDHLDWFVVHSLGLTDPVLPHVVDPGPESQAGHRWVVVPLARDLLRVWASALDDHVARPSLADGDEGVFVRAVRRRVAAPWIARNLAAFDAIEHRTRGERGWPSIRRALEKWPVIPVSRTDIAAAAR